jgi:hypothetical protein
MMFEIRLAVLGALLIVVGVALWSLAAGLVVAGVETLLASYVTAYVKVKAGSSR